LGTEIARLEQQLRHEREQWARYEQEREQTERYLAQVQQTQNEKSVLIEQTRRALESHAKEQARAQQQWQETQGLMEAAETSMQDWQMAWDDFNQRATEPTQSAQVERIRQQQLERQQQQLQQRMTRLEEEARQLTSNDDVEQLDILREELFILEQQAAQQQEALASCAAQISKHREQEKRFSKELHSQQGNWHHLQGHLTSLQALQKAALGRNKGGAEVWLEQQGLVGSLRLAEGLEVELGWEQAVERVLGMHLEAVCVEGLELLADRLLSLEEGSLILFDTATPIPSNRATNSALLLNKVRAPWSLDSLLAGIYTVETLAEALVLRANLAPGESVITRNGIWLGPCWLSLVCESDEKPGVLARGREIERLQQEIAQCQREVSALDGQLEKARERLHTLEGEREYHQSALHALQRELRERQSALARAETEQEQHRVRRKQVGDELDEIRSHCAENEQERQYAEEQLQEALADMEVLAEEREHLMAERDRLWEAVNEARSEATVVKDTVHRLEMEEQTLQTTQKVAQEAVTQAHQEYGRLIQRREIVETALANGQAPLQELQARLETHLQQRITIERQLHEMREQVTTLEEMLHNSEQEKYRVEKAIEEQRAGLERLRVDGQTIQVRAQTLREQLSEEGFSPEEILRDSSEQSELAVLEAESVGIAQRIQRLGLINLAAIDECQAQAERKQYLDSQYADLTEALQTLGNAIQRIDRETRSRFRETFDNVNGGLQTLFPKLFGGGKAYLELNDDDLLNTGVKIMARPPGKRNSTIHLLSGGEKALTAIALVFAIFQLNPAPFCMLDEVDAPLDDANVGRFCELVKEMSEKVQFIIVTHNKSTMEIGHQLTGVTMYEPGVSRLVAVDIDEAVQLAAV
jgi:chromosome segregation protein